LKLKCDGPLSNFAFKFNLRRYIKAEFPSMGAKMIFATCDAKWSVAPENPANAESTENPENA
jgi:hypothetical protein